MTELFSTILLVDDDEITNFINEEIVRGMAIAAHIRSLNDGHEALAFIHKNWIHPPQCTSRKLLLLDINMSTMDGFEVLQRMPQVANLTVVILTTSTHERDRTLAKEHQVFAYLEKPLTAGKLENLFVEMANH